MSVKKAFFNYFWICTKKIALATYKNMVREKRIPTEEVPKYVSNKRVFGRRQSKKAYKEPKT
jgi:hypothetical protein